jgi:hypothetical protein
MLRTRFETTRIPVIGQDGTRTFLIETTPFETDSTMDGGSFEIKKLATLRTMHGDHVNRISANEFESIQGEKFRSA